MSQATANKLEQVVHDALVARSFSSAEAMSMIRKLKSSGVFKQAADIELSADGRLLGLSPVTCLTATPKALCVEWRGVSYWIPINQIDQTSEVTASGDTGILIITKWIAEKKGFCDSNGKILMAP